MPPAGFGAFDDVDGHAGTFQNSKEDLVKMVPALPRRETRKSGYT